MTDDVGFGAASAAGGPIPTPTFDAVAKSGLLYNRFHTTAMCSPTRASLLTGRNHHAVGSGAISEMSVDQPGYTSVLPASAATIGRVLGDNGYSTAWFGKNHNTPQWEYTADGPFDHWPNAMGFDYFYGFFGGHTNQFYPDLIENRNLVHAPRQPGYILDRDLADHAVEWVRRQHGSSPDKPFLLYYAPGTAHMPLHAPADWIARFKGRFDHGWDVERERTFARQKALGVVPANAVLTPRPAQIPAWSSLTADQQKVAAREMEVYAAALAYCDAQIGRVIEELRRLGELDNTLILFLQGDNGAAAENLASTFNQNTTFMGIGEGSHALRHLDEIGGPNSYPAYPVGWAWSMDTPFRWSKMVASHLGGTRNALAVSWTRGIRSRGLRSQFHHVIDLAPTIYQAAGITPPPQVDGVPQTPIDGVSMVYSFERPAAPSTRRSQYFELLGNRAYYEDGWIASTTPKRMPWEVGVPPGQEQTPYRWELYDLNTDFSQAHDLAATQPARLARLKARFDRAARQFQVLPIDDRFLPRFSPNMRPSALQGRNSFTFYPSEQRIPVAAFPTLRTGWRAVASVQLSSAEAGGPVLASGDKFTGWSLYLRRGTPTIVYRTTDQEADRVTLAGPERLNAGTHKLAVAVAASTTGGPNTLSLEVDGKVVASRVLTRLSVAREATYVGRAPETPLIEDPQVPDRFSGTINDVVVTIMPTGGAKRP